MNDLNAQQIVLLTLLVSFVTSIATGITTVSLLEQAPDPVTQTINRIVEKTVERVVPEEKEDGDSNVSVVKTPEKEIVTVVVKEEDLTIDAVDKNSRSLVRIYQKTNDGDIFVALGVVVSDAGEILTDATKINSIGSYKGVYQIGEFELDVTHRELNNAFALLKPKEGQTTETFVPAVLGNSQNLKLAQSIISLSGKIENTVSTGIITGLATDEGAIKEDSPDETPSQSLRKISTSVNSSNVLVGSIILNLQGDIVGLRIAGDPNDPTSFLPANRVSDFLNSRAQE